MYTPITTCRASGSGACEAIMRSIGGAASTSPRGHNANTAAPRASSMKTPIRKPRLRCAFASFMELPRAPVADSPLARHGLQRGAILGSVLIRFFTAKDAKIAEVFHYGKHGERENLF